MVLHSLTSDFLHRIRLRTGLELVKGAQCDKMALLFFQYLAFYNNENLPKVMKYLLQFCQILNSYSRNGQKPFKVLPKWRNFAKSGHTEGASKDLVPNIARIAKGICNNITSDL